MSLNKKKALAATPLEMQKKLNAQTKKQTENLRHLKELKKQTKEQYVKNNEREKEL